MNASVPIWSAKGPTGLFRVLSALRRNWNGCAQFQPAAVLDRIQRLEELNGIANASRADADGAEQAIRGE